MGKKGKNTHTKSSVTQKYLPYGGKWGTVRNTKKQKRVSTTQKKTPLEIHQYKWQSIRVIREIVDESLYYIVQALSPEEGAVVREEIVIRRGIGLWQKFKNGISTYEQ